MSESLLEPAGRPHFAQGDAAARTVLKVRGAPLPGATATSLLTPIPGQGLRHRLAGILASLEEQGRQEWRPGRETTPGVARVLCLPPGSLNEEGVPRSNSPPKCVNLSVGISV